MARGHINGASSETQSHGWKVVSLLTITPTEAAYSKCNVVDVREEPKRYWNKRRKFFFLCLWSKCHYWPLSQIMVFKVSFEWYIIERWIETGTLIWPRSRCFKRIDGIHFSQKYSRISTWSQHIPTHSLLPLEKDRRKWASGAFGFLIF